MEDLIELAKYACMTAEKEGAEFVDVVASKSRDISAGIERNSVKHGDANTSSGISVRVFIRGGMGFTSTTGLDKNEIKEISGNAVALAKIAQPDPDFVSLPAPASYPAIEGLFDEKIAGMDTGRAIRYLLANIESAKSVNADVILNGGIGLGYSEAAIVNSLGVEGISRDTSISLNVETTIRKGDDVGSFYDFDYARRLSDFSAEGLGANAAKMALKFLGPSHISGGVMPVVFSPLSSMSIFSAICSNANAEDVQRNRSYLVGKKGRQIASELVTIVDNPLIPGGLSSGPFDGEGFPRKPLTIIEKGTLKSLLHNSYTSNKVNEPNTGHSTRGGISPTNINPVLGAKTEKEIIGEVKDGLYVALGSLSPNSASGDISATLDWVFKIENGEITYPVKNIMIGINMLDLLKDIDAVSSDYREEPGTKMPAVRVKYIRVAGGKK